MFDNKTLFEAASVGEALDTFQNSKVGIFLYKRAKSQILAGMYELAEANPEDTKSIREIQNKIKVAQNFQSWISEGIMEGMQSYQHLQEEFEGDPQQFYAQPDVENDE